MPTRTKTLAAAVQWSMIALGLAMLFLPSLRTPSVQYVAGLLMVSCTIMLGWRLHRHGTGHLTLPALWHRLRNARLGVDVGVGPLDLLSSFVGFLAVNLH